MGYSWVERKELAIKQVQISSDARRDLRKVPVYIADKLLSWIGRVEKVGVEEVRKFKGYHDEPLRGDRKGQRSLRLSKSYRAIYEIKNNNSIEEVNKHDY